MTNTQVPADPIERFREWFDGLPYASDDMEKNAMALATASCEGIPSVRVVLLKGFDERGFVFFTNMESHKSHDLKENPQASLNFWWARVGKQVRVTGNVELVSDQEADEYFSTRPLVSRIGALASRQSHLLDNRKVLTDKVAELQKIYTEQNPPPRPSGWSGWRVVPQEVEFWQEGGFRLHDRDLYTRAGKSWKICKLYP